MKSASSSVKYAQQGDFLYCLKKFALLILGIFSPVMFLLIYSGVRSDSKDSAQILSLAALFQAVGIAVGLQAAEFLISKKKSDLWLSLGIRKKELLENRIIAALLCLLFSFALSFALPLFLKLSRWDYDTVFSNYTPIQDFLIITAGTAVLTLLNFSLTVFFCVKTGTLRISVLLTIITQTVPVLFDTFILELFKGSINGSILLAEGFDASEIYFIEDFTTLFIPGCLSIFHESNIDIVYFFFSVLFNLIISLVAILLSFYALKKHRPENIDSPLSSRMLSDIIGIAVYLGIGTAVIKHLEFDLTYLLLLTLPVAGFFAVKLLTCLKKKKPFVLSLKQSVPAVLLSVIIVLFCKTYAFGYLLKVPDINDIEYACISPSSTFHLNTYYEPNPIKEVTQGMGYFESEKDLTFITGLHRLTAKNTGKGKSRITFHYKLKNGHTITRSYLNVSDEAALKSLEFADSDWFEKHLNACFGIHCTSEDYVYEYYLYPEMIDTYLLCNNTLNESLDLEALLSVTDIYYLKEAIIDDLMNLTAEEIFMPKEQPLYYLHFYSSEYIYNTSPIPVYETMKNTVNFLSDKNISIGRITADEIDSVQYVKLTGDINSFYKYKGNYTTSGFFDKTMSAAYSSNRIIFNRDIIVQREWLSIDNLTEKGYLPLDTPITVQDKTIVEKYFNAHKAHYCTIGDKGIIASFHLKKGGYFTAYIPESEL